MQYTKKQREYIFELLKNRLDKAFDNEEIFDSEEGKKIVTEPTPIWKNIFFLLDKYISGNFFGNISIKILGSSAKDVVVSDRTYRMEVLYLDEEDKLSQIS